MVGAELGHAALQTMSLGKQVAGWGYGCVPVTPGNEVWIFRYLR
jgi:hypothetical protein